MYICKPERNVFQVKMLLTVSVLVTAGLFLLSTLIPVYAGVIRFVAFGALMLSLLFNVRYSLTEFEYIVGNGDFSIVKITGNRRQTVCCVALESAIDLYTKRDYDHLPSAEKGIVKYSLNQNMKAESFVFLCEFNGKRAMIEFEPNEAFVSILKKEISAYKNNQE